MHEILSNEYVEKLISLPKKIVLNDELRDYYQLPCSSLFSTRMPIQSIDGNQIFLLQISQSSKNRLKIDLHWVCQEFCVNRFNKQHRIAA